MSCGVTTLTIGRARQIYTDRLRTSVKVIADGIIQERALRHIWKLHGGRREVQHFTRTVLTVDRYPWAAFLDSGGLLWNMLADDLERLQSYLR